MPDPLLHADLTAAINCREIACICDGVIEAAVPPGTEHLPMTSFVGLGLAFYLACKAGGADPEACIAQIGDACERGHYRDADAVAFPPTVHIH